MTTCLYIFRFVFDTWGEESSHFLSPPLYTLFKRRKICWSTKMTISPRNNWTHLKIGSGVVYNLYCYATSQSFLSRTLGITSFEVFSKEKRQNCMYNMLPKNHLTWHYVCSKFQFWIQYKKIAVFHDQFIFVSFTNCSFSHILKPGFKSDRKVYGPNMPYTMLYFSLAIALQSIV